MKLRFYLKMHHQRFPLGTCNSVWSPTSCRNKTAWWWKGEIKGNLFSVVWNWLGFVESDAKHTAVECA